MIRPTPQPKEQRNGINKVGRKGEEWRRVWSWLKPRLAKAGRTQCEFGFIKHECYGPLDPCHSKKRRLWEGDDAYVLAIGCRRIHDDLDLRMTHAEMEKAVWKAINLNGGVILPKERKAA